MAQEYDARGASGPGSSKPGQGLLQRLWGRDVFISYSRADGATYALGLAAHLSGRGFACVIDQWGVTIPGLVTPERVRRLLRSCRALVIVGTQASGASVHVAEEVAEFVKSSGMIIPIDLDGTIQAARWWPLIEGLPITVESGGRDARAPDENVLARLANALTFHRRDQRLRRVAYATASVLAIMVAGLGMLAFQGRGLARDNAVAREDLRMSRDDAKALEVRADAADVALKQTTTELTTQKEALTETRDRARRATAAADAAESRANQANQLAARQERIARRYSAENLLNAARTHLTTDPARAARLAEAAIRIEPEIDTRNVLVQAAVSGPAWNRFPAFPAEDYQGELIPGLDDRTVGFATDPTVSTVVRIEPGQGDRLLITDVDSGRTIRSLPLLPGETVSDLAPLARKLLVLTRPSGGHLAVRVFSFDDLRDTAGPAEPRLETLARSIDCAGGDWPCGLLTADGRLQVAMSPGSGSLDHGSFSNADRVLVHPSGRAVAVVAGGQVTWIPLGEGGAAGRVVLTFNAELQYPYQKAPLPWLKWGPQPYQLLVADAVQSAGERQMVEKATLWAVDASRDSRQRLRDWDMELNGLALPVFETDATARRVAMGVMKRGDGSRLEILTLDWSNTGSDQMVAVSAPEEGVLRGATGSEAEYSVQTASLSPNGGFVVVGGDRRGLSGTQMGRGVLDSWNLHPLDEDSSLRPEQQAFPILGGRHVKRIAYSSDSRRIAVLDATSGVTVFKVRTTEGPVFQQGLRLDEDLLQRLAPTTTRLDTGSRTWMTRYGAEDVRLYDLLSGAETRLSSASDCGGVLAAQQLGGQTLVVMTQCVRRLRDGKTAAEVRLPLPARSAVISDNLISVLLADRAMFLRSEDLGLLGVAQLADSPGLADHLADSGSVLSEPDKAVYYPVLGPDDQEISFLSLDSARVMERWSASLDGSGGPVRFQRTWTRQFAASKWTSVRAMPGGVIMALFGSNSPDDTPQLFQVRAQDGALVDHFGMRAFDTKLFEVAATGRLGPTSAYAALRLSGGGLILGVWSPAGGAPLRWSTIATQRYLSGEDILGIQPHGADHLLFLRSESGQRAYSLETGRLVWQGVVEDRLPSPPLRNAGGTWSIADPGALKAVVRRIQSGGGDTVEAITRIALPPEDLVAITGGTSQTAQD